MGKPVEYAKPGTDEWKKQGRALLKRFDSVLYNLHEIGKDAAAVGDIETGWFADTMIAEMNKKRAETIATLERGFPLPGIEVKAAFPHDEPQAPYGEPPITGVTERIEKKLEELSSDVLIAVYALEVRKWTFDYSEGWRNADGIPMPHPSRVLTEGSREFIIGRILAERAAKGST